MYQRRARRRQLIGAAIVAVLVLASGAVSNWWGFASSAGPGGVDDVEALGPIFSDADRYETEMLRDDWIRSFPIRSTTYGAVLPKQYRISLEGAGPAVSQTAVLQTSATQQLFDDPTSTEQAKQFLRGLQREFDRRNAQVKGVSFSPSAAGFAANWISVSVEQGIDADYVPEEFRAFIEDVLTSQALSIAEAAYAWYQFDTTWIVFGPETTRTLVQFMRDPSSVSEEDGGLLALIVAHEMEHAVSAVDGAHQRETWMEEGLADVLANWPGRTAEVARSLGLPYNTRADDVAFDQVQKVPGGYPKYMKVYRDVLPLAGIDVDDPAAFDDVSTLLQDVEYDEVPASIAQAVADHQGLGDDSIEELASAFVAIEGRPAKVAAFERVMRSHA